MARSNEPRLGGALQHLLVLFGALLLVVGDLQQQVDSDTTRYQPVKLLAGGFVRNVTLGLDTYTGQQVDIFITDTCSTPPATSPSRRLADPPNCRGRWC